MNKLSPETKVGIFAIVVVLALTYMTLKVGGFLFGWEKGYTLYAVFEDISGLDEKTRIKIAGVDSGMVEKIRLKGGKAELTLIMYHDVMIYEDARATLKMSGLLGEKYFSLTTGTPVSRLLKDGDTIINIDPASDVDALTNELTAAASTIGDLARVFNDIFGETERKSVSETIDNLRAATENLRDIIIRDREPLSNIIMNLESFSKALNEKGPGLIDDLSRLAGVLGDKGPGLVEDLSSSAKEFREVIAENRLALKDGIEKIRSVSETTESIVQKIDSGEGTLGKLLENDGLYDSLTKVADSASKTLEAVERLRIFMDFRAEYNTGDDEWKSRFDLTLQPRKDKYYILGVVRDLKGSVERVETTVDGSKTIEETVESKLEFTAQFGKRFDDLILRIGLMESTFGFGADYLFLNDKGRVSLDVWDFSYEEVDADKAHIKLGVDYRFFKYLFVSGGIDNMLNDERRGVYVGGGLKFEDKDFKYFISKVPEISFN